MFKTSISILRKKFKNYAAANDGVAAIEFVFVAPIMIAMYFGLAEISSAIEANRKVSHAANVAGDLATQVASVTADDLSDIMTAANLIVGVTTNKVSNVKMELASFSRDSAGAVVPLGKASLNGTLPPFNANDLDDLILSETSGVVVARLSYDYEPLKLKFFDSNITLNETFLLKPRKSAAVEFGTTGTPTDFTCSITNGSASCS